MSIRDILVHLKSHEDWSPHIDYAIRTAKLFSCPSARPRHVSRGRNVAQFAPLFRAKSRGPDGEGCRHCVASQDPSFSKPVPTAGVVGSFDTAEGAAGELIPWASRLHDLTIIEQRQPESDELGFDAAEETALSAGRPVLLIPAAGNSILRQNTSSSRGMEAPWLQQQSRCAAFPGAGQEGNDLLR